MNYFQQQGGATLLNLSAGVPNMASTPQLGDVARLLSDGMLKPILDGLRQAGGNFFDSLTGGTPAHTTWGRSGGSSKVCGNCGCGKPQPQPDCHCQCCVGDADVLVYARLGETRVVPLLLENSWRRERQITATLSSFSSKGGKASPVTGKLLPPAPSFTLAPCGQQTLVLVLSSSLEAAGDSPTSAQQATPIDVDDCSVSYANLELSGCDRRPLRVAVALLPRDCQALCIDCACACSCCG